MKLCICIQPACQERRPVAMRSLRAQAVLVLLLLLCQLTTAKISPYGTDMNAHTDCVTDGCTCVEGSHNGSTTRFAVSCRRATFTSADFVTHLPPSTEAIIVEESDLDHVPTTDLFLTPPNIITTYPDVKHLRMLNNRNFHQKLNLQSLLCLFTGLEELHIVNTSLLDSHMELNNDSCIPRNLRLLNLSLNKARRLPSETIEVLQNHPHVIVNLTGNTFSCDCNFLPTYYWLFNQSRRLINPDTYTCRDGYPETLGGRRVFEIEADEFRCLDDPFLVPAPPLSLDSSHVISNEAMSSIYSVVIVLGVMASVVAIFALFLNFPFLLPCASEDRPLLLKRKATGSKKLLLNPRRYTSLPSLNSETPA